jgi:hypothetical protein
MPIRLDTRLREGDDGAWSGSCHPIPIMQR